MSNETTLCPYCKEEIKEGAIKCKHCGEILDSDVKAERIKEKRASLPKIRKWSPGVAAVLSLIIPGAGQMYKGNVLSGLFWLFIVIIGYVFLIIPGLILHLICIVLAASGDPYK